jgi:diguanylate cyclase (GGDEF)-like protein
MDQHFAALGPTVTTRRSFGNLLNAPEHAVRDALPQAPSAGSRAVSRLDFREILRGSLQPGTWDPRSLARLATVFCIAAVFSWLGIVLSHQSEGVATIWLSNGIVFGLLITQPKRRWLAYFLAGLAADTLADVFYGDPFKVAIGVSLANCFEVVSSTLLLTLWFGSPLDLSKRRSLVGFLLVTVLGATAVTSALGASWTLLFYDAGPWWQMFRTWWLGDMLGMAVLVPLISIVQRPAFFSMLEPRQLPQTAWVLAFSLLTTVAVFLHNSDPLIFLMFPAFLLVAFRLGFPGTVVNVLLVTLTAIGLTVKGHGPLMLIPGEHMLLHRIVVAQVFAAVAIFTLFPVAAVLEEKEALKQSLADSEARFRGLALSDELTGLYNRRAFNLHLESAWQDACASGHLLGLILLDADLFKQYNDLYGHLGGDECLRALATVVATTAAETGGVAARFGGEEFALILTGTSREQAVQIAESIRHETLALRIPHPSSPHGIQTVSLGVAAVAPEAGNRATSLVNLADQSLYAAKNSGRNRTACA